MRAYILDQRINGHDSFRPATLRWRADPSRVGSTGPAEERSARVRVLTLDDVTVVTPLPGQPDLPDSWVGTLVLPSGHRGPAMPDDLAHALTEAGVDPGGLDGAVGRHLVGFVAEARPGPTRDARVAAAVDAVRRDLVGR